MNRVAPWAALWFVLGAASGCRGLHEEQVSDRFMGRELTRHEFSLSMAKFDAMVETTRAAAQMDQCELCLVSSRGSPDGRREYCFIGSNARGCVIAHEFAPGRLRLVAESRVLPTSLARALWHFIDSPSATAIEEQSVTLVPAATLEEEESFAGAWSFFGAAGTTAVIGLESSAVGFGAQAGFRRWLNYYMLGGAGLEVESMPFTVRPFSVLGLQGRAELSMWEERFRRTLNLPGVTFLMSVTPLVAFGAKPAFGARAAIGVQVLRLGNAWTPVRLEIGYQYLVVNGFAVTGARAGLMLGF